MHLESVAGRSSQHPICGFVFFFDTFMLQVYRSKYIDLLKMPIRIMKAEEVSNQK
jgi:hypothetical protein